MTRHQLEEAAQDAVSTRRSRSICLREQMKIIQAELGEDGRHRDSESTAYREKIQALHLPEESEQRLLKEVARLKKQPFGSVGGVSVIRNYLDICLEMPWNTRTEETARCARTRARCSMMSISASKRSRSASSEYLAVRQLAPECQAAACCAWSALRAPARRASP